MFELKTKTIKRFSDKLVWLGWRWWTRWRHDGAFLVEPGKWQSQTRRELACPSGDMNQVPPDALPHDIACSVHYTVTGREESLTGRWVSKNVMTCSTDQGK